MSNFTPLVKKEYEFEGDTVSVAFCRMKRKHTLRLLPIIQNLSKANNSEDAKFQEAAQSDLLEKLTDILPEHVKEFSGLKDSDGNPIDFNTVIDDSYFFNLVVDIGMALIDNSLATMGASGKNE
jgi:hypothetical protein